MNLAKVARRRYTEGVTPLERLDNFTKALIGKEAICTHTVVADVFGRFYGQGAKKYLLLYKPR